MKHASSPIHSSVLPLTIILLIFAIAMGDPVTNFWLRYDTDAIRHGEWWRLISGHLAHLGWKHVLMNVAGLILIWTLFGKLISHLQWLLIMGLSSLFISIMLFNFNTEIRWYVGLSGVLHAMFVAGTLVNIKRGYKAEIFLLLALCGKLIYEQITGALPGSSDFAGGMVVVDAHLYGAISGLIMIMVIFLSQLKLKN